MLCGKVSSVLRFIRCPISSYVLGRVQVLIFHKRHSTGVNLVERSEKVKEDCSLRATRDGHSSSSSISPTLLVFLYHLQVHLAAVFCTPPPVQSEFHDRDAKIWAAYSS